MEGVAVSTFKEAAAALGADWKNSALQQGVMDGALGRAPVQAHAPTAKARREWGDLYARSYEWSRRLA